MNILKLCPQSNEYRFPLQVLLVFIMILLCSLTWSSHSNAHSFQDRKIALMNVFMEQVVDLREQIYAEGYTLSDINLEPYDEDLLEILPLTRQMSYLVQVSFQTGRQLDFARELLRFVIASQVDDRANPLYGNFRTSPAVIRGLDQNYVTFILPSLIYIYKYHKHELDTELQRSLRQALDRGHQASIFLAEERIPVWYSNVYAKIIGTLYMLGDEYYSHKYTRELYNFIRDFGINEYGQWNYVVLQLAGLHIAHDYVRNSEMKQMLRELLEFHWWDAVINTHVPTGMYSFTSSRARLERGLVPGDRLQTLLYLYFGIGDENFNLTAPQLLISSYEPPTEMGVFLSNKYADGEFFYHMRYGRVEMQAYQTETYAMATQSGRRSALGMRHTGKTLLSSEVNEISIQLNTVSLGYPGSRFRVNSIRSDFDRYNITSVQDKNRAVVNYNFDLVGVRAEDSNYEVALAAELAHIDGLGDVLINGQLWDQSPTALATDDILVFSHGESTIGLRFLECDVIEINSHAMANEAYPVYLYLDEDQLILHTYLYFDANEENDHKFTREHNGLRAGYVIYMSGQANEKSRQKVTETLKKTIIQQDRDPTGKHQVRVDFADEQYKPLSFTEHLHENLIFSRKIGDRQIHDHGYVMYADQIRFRQGGRCGQIVRDYKLQTAESHESERELCDGKHAYSDFLQFSHQNSSVISEEDALFSISLAPGNMYLHTEHLNQRRMKEHLHLIPQQPAIQMKTSDNGVFLQTQIMDDGLAEAPFLVPMTGEWHFWVKVTWPVPESNEMLLAINKAGSRFFSGEGVGIKRSVITSEKFEETHWIRVTEQMLSRGIHTVSIIGAGRFAKLHELLITNDPSFHPEALP